MNEKVGLQRRRYHAHATARAAVLDGVLLATFGQRMLGYVVDLLIAMVIWAPLEFAWKHYLLHEQHIDLKWDFHEAGNIMVILLYLGLANYFGNGKTPGKWVARIRAVSLTGESMGPWQSVERALGYGAAVLEGGLGFVQFFWDRNRMCAQDRLAETIVVDERKQKRRTMME
jgi:RDD family